jgi:DNA-binding SARP family transcriptional activator
MAGHMATSATSTRNSPVVVCVLGSFRLQTADATLSVKPGGKAELLLANLALQRHLGLPREQVLSLLWPSSETQLANHSLNTLIYSLHRLLGDVLGGLSPITYAGGHYRLNGDGGVAVDVDVFDAAVDKGDRAARAGNEEEARSSYRRATELYAGDLVLTSEIRHIVERERLRARYLSARAYLIDVLFALGNYAEALVGSLDLLAQDPCREDAHRLVMRCYNRLGQRSQALRQYHLCREFLADEFDAVPEPATLALYESLRTDPSGV